MACSGITLPLLCCLTVPSHIIIQLILRHYSYKPCKFEVTAVYLNVCFNLLQLQTLNSLRSASGNLVTKRRVPCSGTLDHTHFSAYQSVAHQSCLRTLLCSSPHSSHISNHIIGFLHTAFLLQFRSPSPPIFTPHLVFARGTTCPVSHL
jgi:hypothetical protein